MFVLRLSVGTPEIIIISNSIETLATLNTRASDEEVTTSTTLGRFGLLGGLVSLVHDKDLATIIYYKYTYV